VFKKTEEKWNCY